MSIAPTLKRYLTAENIQYEEIPHELTMSSRAIVSPRASCCGAMATICWSSCPHRTTFAYQN